MGGFSPSAFKTDQFEVAYKRHKAGEDWPEHYQKVATEINLLVSGTMKAGGQLLFPGDIFTVMPGETIKPEFITDVAVVCVKVPSLPGDKVVV